MCGCQKDKKALYMCFLKNSKVNYLQGSLMSCLLVLYKKPKSFFFSGGFMVPHKFRYTQHVCQIVT